MKNNIAKQLKIKLTSNALKFNIILQLSFISYKVLPMYLAETVLL